MRDLRSKKMPAKPMKMVEADDELALDMPADDEELGAEEAEMDLEMDPAAEEPMMDEKALSDMMADVSDDDLIAEMKARGLSMDDSEEAAPEVEEAEEDAASEEEI